MTHIAEVLLTDLGSLVAELGKDGGLIGPSIYDTAQVLRWAPPHEGTRPALDWLCMQQRSDGGWGDPNIPLARTVPTLAAAIALHLYCETARDRSALAAALAFLRSEERTWPDKLPNDVPVGAELIAPSLLVEAHRVGLEIPETPYASLLALGQRRSKMMGAIRVQPGTTVSHIVEAISDEIRSGLVDFYGSVGHSPAATAAWLHKTEGSTEEHQVRARAMEYLTQAAAVTGVDIPGVVPTAWPITRFEQSFVLYALLLGDLLVHPRLQGALREQYKDLSAALHPTGLGFSDHFMADGDDTAAAIAVLRVAGQPVSLEGLEVFNNGDHYSAYRGELQVSVTVTARAVHALRLFGRDVSRNEEFLLSHQDPDGAWRGDKWNGSWLYATLQVIAGLRRGPVRQALEKTYGFLLEQQRPDGSWGTQRNGSTEETAYGILSLRLLETDGIGDTAKTRVALRRAAHWMLVHYQPFCREQPPFWIAKETYRPERIARAFELSALLSVLNFVDPESAFIG
ncbi:MAG TPA: prenyltransferase/squalene oxidase repeat-containing protein [Polyangia bacterium]|nr:prenyltransferase/squalene oxidase repeat-containing protein [Polyangia bacterium]